MRALAVAVSSTMLSAGCIDLQGSYTASARKECREIINSDERRACLNRVEENDYARRAERRRTSDSADDSPE